MSRRLVRRSSVLAAAATLLLAGSAFADGVAADGDRLDGVQTFVDLGTVAPGATIERDVDLILSCGSVRHVDPGQIVTVFQTGGTVPALPLAVRGSITATGTTIGPVPPTWANDTQGISGCTGPMHVDGDAPSHVTIIAPLVEGVDYLFSVEYGRSLAPAGVLDANSVSGSTIITYMLDVEDVVVDDTPPTLSGVPGDLDLVTADANGTVLVYAMPTASDDQDPAPAVACDPAPGAHVPVGSTTVRCTATDATGNQSSASFVVTVRLGVVAWDDPVHGTDVTANRGRNLPVKVRAWLDGVALSGPAHLEVWACGPGGVAPERSLDATWQVDPARWMAGLDTSGLAVGCHTVALVRDGSTLGTFTLHVVDSSAAGGFKGKLSNRPA